MENIVSEGTSRIVGCFFDYTSRRFKNLIDLSTNIKDLRDKKMKALIAKECDVKAVLQREEERRKQPLEVVKDWLAKVDEAKNKVEVIIATYEEKVKGNCFRRLCGLCGLFELAETVAEEIIKEVDELLGEELPDELVIDQLPPRAILFNSLSLARSRLSTTTEEKIKEIMGHLINPSIRKIGVYGMGGIGKTTIMKTVNDRLATDGEEHFDRIIWVTVSKDMGGIETLQSGIAKQLGEAFSGYLSSENDKERRASMLLNKLKDQKKLLLILDDLWEEISLAKIGIPDPESSQEGSKMVVTTRFLTVCDSIKTQANVEIKPLSDEDAWELFKAMIDDDKLLHRKEIEPLAREVVHECGGLPLAIVVIGPVMRRMHNLEQWSHNLKKLKSSKAEIEGPEGNVFQLLRFSYNHLKGQQIKKCFLYCAFYPEDHRIEIKQLIEHWMAEGYIVEEENDVLEYNTWIRRDEIGRALDILKELTDSCMLEMIQEEEKEYVRLHDLVRDLAIQIMGEDYGFVSKAGLKLTEFPELAWEKVSKISLMNNEILNFPQRQLNCPNLSTLLIRDNPPPWQRFGGMKRDTSGCQINFIESFFCGMLALQVLDLSHSDYIVVLPSSLSELTNLRALYLQMTYLNKMPSLAKLKKLRVLDLSWTYIEELQGLEHLTNLRFLNLAATNHLKYIQADAISKLTLLEELHVSGCAFFSYIDSTYIQDLPHLKRLSVVETNFWSYENYLKAIAHIKWNELTDFYIVLCADSNGVSREVAHKTKVVSIYGLDICNQLSSFCLPVSTEGLCLDRCDLPQLCGIPHIVNLKSLKKLYLESKYSGECLVMGDEMEPDMLASLEGLKLRDLDGLKVIMKGVLSRGCFENLKSIYVDKCNCLKRLFTYKILQQLKNIEVIKVKFSDEIEEICSSIDDEDNQRDETTIDEIVLPNLRILHLWNLPKLHSISTKIWVCESLKIIVILSCPQLGKLPFDGLPALENFYVISEWWDEWNDTASKTLYQPFFLGRLTNVDDVDPILELGSF